MVILLRVNIPIGTRNRYLEYLKISREKRVIDTFGIVIVIDKFDVELELTK